MIVLGRTGEPPDGNDQNEIGHRHAPRLGCANRLDDGVILRADVFCPVAPGRDPVILSHGRYAKGLAFQE